MRRQGWHAASLVIGAAVALPAAVAQAEVIDIT